MVQGFDRSVVADESGELGRSGLLGGQAGDGVNCLDGGLAGLAVGALTLDLDGLAGSGTRGLFTVATLIRRISECRGRFPGCGPEAGCPSREGT